MTITIVPFVISLLFGNLVHNSLSKTFRSRLSFSMSMNNKKFITMGKDIRPLGGFERLLSRKTPSKNEVSLSHGCAIVLSGSISPKDLRFALEYVMVRHPMLRSYISTSTSQTRPSWRYCEDSLQDLQNKVLNVIEVDDSDFDNVWKSELEGSLNGAEFPAQGPLWKLSSIQSKSSSGLSAADKKSAWVFCMNHGTDDQQSVDIMVSDMLTACRAHRAGNYSMPESLPFPTNMETAVARDPPGIGTALWALFQLGNLVAGASVIPHRLASGLRIAPEKFASHINPDKRRTICEYVNLSVEEMNFLRKRCREEGVTVSHLLAAVMSCATAKYIECEAKSSMVEKVRFLLSVGLRPFGVDNVLPGGQRDPTSDWSGGTVACAGGAVDYILQIPQQAGAFFRHLIQGSQSASSSSPSLEAMEKSFWDLARDSGTIAKDMFDKGFVPESVRLFGLGMEYADILKVVEIDAASASTLGRGFSCGVSNVGLQSFQSCGDLEVDKVFYGTSQARNGLLIQLSCITTDKGFSGCLQASEPLLERADLCQVKTDVETCLKQLLCVSLITK
eukprot:gene9435-19597_t